MNAFIFFSDPYEAHEERAEDETPKNDAFCGTETEHDRGTVEGVMSSKDGHHIKPKIMPCLTIPKPFQDHSGNVLRSMLYKGPSLPKNDELTTAPETHIVNPSRTAPLKASAHSAFDKVLPGGISARTKCPRVSPTLAHQHNPTVRISHLSQLQLDKFRGHPVMLRQESLDAELPTSFRQRGENALRGTGLVNPRFTEMDITDKATFQQISDEPLNLKVKRPEEDTSRPHSTESSTHSRDSLSPNDADYIPKKKYILDRHDYQFDSNHPDSPPLASNAVFALRTPRYTPTVSSLGSAVPQNHINWAYATYYHQAQYAGHYGAFYPHRYTAIPPNDIHMLHQSFRPFNTTPISTSHNTDISEGRPGDISSLSNNSSPKSPLEETSNKPSIESSKSDNPDAGETPTQKPKYREYLVEHLKNIRSNIFHHQQSATARPIARQPVLGLEYIQNGTDIKVDGDMEECPDDIEEGVDGDKDIKKGEEIDNVQELNDSDKGRDKQEQHLSAKASGVSGMEVRQKLSVPLPTANVKTPQPKKYKCDICFKGFSRSNTLVTHKVRWSRVPISPVFSKFSQIWHQVFSQDINTSICEVKHSLKRKVQNNIGTNSLLSVYPGYLLCKVW